MRFYFSWILEGKVAGMGRPRPEDAPWLQAQGVTAILSLTQRPPGGFETFEIRHLPTPDMTSPTLDQLHAAVGFLRKVVTDGGAVVVHCGAGMGRTGTVLAAFLVAEGMAARTAIAAVRARRPGSIETPDQEQRIVQYAELTGGAVE
jgi:atypical dual specificity phosphatase